MYDNNNIKDGKEWFVRHYYEAFTIHGNLIILRVDADYWNIYIVKPNTVTEIVNK